MFLEMSWGPHGGRHGWSLTHPGGSCSLNNRCSKDHELSGSNIAIGTSCHSQWCEYLRRLRQRQSLPVSLKNKPYLRGSIKPCTSLFLGWTVVGHPWRKTSLCRLWSLQSLLVQLASPPRLLLLQFVCFETGSHYAAQAWTNPKASAGRKLEPIFLPRPPKCWAWSSGGWALGWRVQSPGPDHTHVITNDMEI